MLTLGQGIGDRFPLVCKNDWGLIAIHSQLIFCSSGRYVLDVGRIGVKIKAHARGGTRVVALRLAGGAICLNLSCRHFAKMNAVIGLMDLNRTNGNAFDLLKG